jgi:hypothetical protein
MTDLPSIAFMASECFSHLSVSVTSLPKTAQQKMPRLSKSEEADKHQKQLGSFNRQRRNENSLHTKRQTDVCHKKSPIYREKERAHVHPLIGAVDCISARKIKNDADAIRSEILNAMKTNDQRKFKKALEQQYILLSRKGTLVL